MPWSYLSIVSLFLFTVGDPSGSHSERYILRVGHVSHQSPDYGVVGSGTYEFTHGRYSITLQHYGTIYPSPDYDYTASVEKVSGRARVTVEDPQGMHTCKTELLQLAS